MALKINYLNSFNKTAKKHKFDYDKKELEDCLIKIANGEILDSKYKDHKLRWPWKKYSKALPFRDFHITNRLCVVYLTTEDSVDVYALGTHKELDLAESLNNK